MDKMKTWIESTRTFINEVIGELRKVIWPTWDRTLKMTGIVIGMVALVAVYLFLLDLPLSWGVIKFLGRD
ncbi:MAG TPA: preprotein translocase subunit SecE [Symbiobacteriaceae bacterium]